jgi:putative Mn2+ efflux pump MntP
MDTLTVILLSVGLAMDAAAVSIAGGVTVREGRARTAITLAILFGVFQTGMTIAGWYGGSLFSGYIEGFDHWIAFLLLAVIGGKMLHEGLKGEDGAAIPFDRVPVLLMLGVATSIDALAVGLSLALLGSEILGPAIVIGIVTAALSLLSFWIGTVFGDRNRDRAAILGGIILILIGIRILAEHLLT